MAKVQILEQLSAGFFKFRQRNPNGFLALILGAILILDYVLVLSFQLGALNSFGLKLKQMNVQLATAQSDIQREPHFQAELTKLKAQIELLGGRVKVREEIPQVMEHISRLANANSVRLEQILPDVAAEKLLVKNPEGTYYLIPIVIEARGGYHHFGRFVDQLEREGGVDISELTIAGGVADDLTLNVIKLILNMIVIDKPQKG